MIIEIAVQAEDIENVRYVLAACQALLQAQDLIKAQTNLTSVRPSALTEDVTIVKAKFDYYFSQWLIERYESEQAEDDPDAEEDGSIDPEASESLEGDALEDLPDDPFGKPKLSKQPGRRLSTKELKARQEGDPEE